MDIQALLRHVNLATSRIYTHVSEDRFTSCSLQVGFQRTTRSRSSTGRSYTFWIYPIGTDCPDH